MFLSHVLNWYLEDRWITFEEEGKPVSTTINGSAITTPVKLTVVSGSTMPRSRVQEREEALNMYDKGAIDNEELLKKLDWSDRKGVVKRMQAGPLGELIDKIAAMGMPEQIVVAIRELSQTDDKAFKQLADKGEVPQVGAILQQMAQQEAGLPQQPIITPVEHAEIGVKQAEVGKISVETELIRAKIDTERANQQATMAGMQFDGEKLNIEKAQTLNSIEDGKHRRNLDKANFLHTREQSQKEKPVHYDKNVTMTTNEPDEYGKSTASTVETQTVPVDDSAFQGKTAETAGQGPFNEKGLVSDNKEKLNG
jgi:hypothetical protein